MSSAAPGPEALPAQRWSAGEWIFVAMLALLAWPLHPEWLDYEAARRGLLVAVGGLCLLLSCTGAGGRLAVSPGASGHRLGLQGLIGVVFVLSVAVPSAGAPAPDPVRRLYWLALLAVGLFAARQRRPEGRGTVETAIPWLAWPVLVLVFAQRLGLEWPTGAGPLDPVGTLGNRGVAAEWLVIVLMAWLTRSAGRTRVLDWIGLGAVALAIGLLDVRNAFVAVGVGLAALVAVHRWPGRGSPSSPTPTPTPNGATRTTAQVALVAVLSVLGASLAASPEEAVDGLQGQTRIQLPNRITPSTTLGGETVEVRLEIWKGALELAAEEPLFGHGPGAFRPAYPRVRSSREIELSSFGRQIPTGVYTAHNDALEVLVEGGALGLGLGLAILVLVLRSSLRHRWRQGVVVLSAMASLAMFRSPFLSAPTAALFVALVAQRPLDGPGADPTGSPDRSDPRIPEALRVSLFALLGLAALWFGTRAVVGSVLLANYRDGASTDALDAAIAWDPHESRYVLMRLAARYGLTDNNLLGTIGGQSAEQSAADLDALVRLDPDNAFGLLWRAQLLREAGDRAGALHLLDRQLDNDPEDPIAQQLAGLVLVESGEVEPALELLVLRTAPALRPSLPSFLAQLAGVPLIPDRDHDRLNSAALTAAVGEASRRADPDDPLSMDVLDRAVRALERNRGRADPTANIGRAAHTLLSGRRDLASAMAPGRPLELDRFDRALLEDPIHRLGILEPWKRVLPEE